MMKNQRKGKHGHTIGVKHYLNKRLKGNHISTNPETKEIEYPVYVQITAKKQTIRIRSALHVFCAERKFEEFCIKRSHDIENEKAIIRRYILSKKPFDDPSFKLEWSWIDADEKYTLNGIVTDFLNILIFKRLREEMLEQMIRSERFWKRAENNDLPCRILNDDEYKESLEKYRRESKTGSDEFDLQHRLGMAYFSSDNANFYSMFFSFLMPEMKKLREEFSPEFWDFSSYVEKIGNVQQAQFITIDDLENGSFDTLFMATWNDEKALKEIHKGFNHLKETYPYFKDIVDQYRLFSAGLEPVN